MTRARMPRPHEVAAARKDPRLLRAFSERQDDAAWRTRGVCQTVDPETFFPAPSEPADAAVALCRTCGGQGACPAWGLDVRGRQAGGGVDARALRAVGAAALSADVAVARVPQPYRVRGRRTPPPVGQLDEAWTGVVSTVRNEAEHLIFGGRSSGARVACRTARALGAAGVVALAL